MAQKDVYECDVCHRQVEQPTATEGWIILEGAAGHGLSVQFVTPLGLKQVFVQRLDFCSVDHYDLWLTDLIKRLTHEALVRAGRMNTP